MIRAAARQPMTAKWMDDALVAIERDDKSEKGVLPGGARSTSPISLRSPHMSARRVRAPRVADKLPVRPLYRDFHPPYSRRIPQGWVAGGPLRAMAGAGVEPHRRHRVDLHQPALSDAVAGNRSPPVYDRYFVSVRCLR